MSNSHLQLDFLHFGIKSIDAQHQKFYSLLSELQMYHTNGDDNTAVLDILEELSNYTQYHFDMEKRIMERIDYPDIEEHLKQHDVFVDKINEFRKAYSYQSASLSDQMLAFLQKWFLVHIPAWDAQYVEYIKQRKLTHDFSD